MWRKPKCWKFGVGIYVVTSLFSKGSTLESKFVFNENLPLISSLKITISRPSKICAVSQVQRSFFRLLKGGFQSMLFLLLLLDNYCGHDQRQQKIKSQIPFGQRQHVIERRMKVTQASLDCSDTKFGALRGTCLSKPVMRIIFCICSPISVEFTSVCA